MSEFKNRYSPSEAADILGLKVSSVYALLSRRELHGFHDGRRRVITDGQLNEYLQNKGAKLTTNSKPRSY